MLIMASIIRVGQSKFVSVPIDEDSNERIMKCIQTLGELRTETSLHEVFLDDTKDAFAKMLGAQEVCKYRIAKKKIIWSLCRKGQLRRKQLRPKRRLSFKSMIWYRSGNFRRRRPTRSLMWVLFLRLSTSFLMAHLGRWRCWSGDWHRRCAGRLYFQSQPHRTVDGQV